MAAPVLKKYSQTFDYKHFMPEITDTSSPAKVIEGFKGFAKSNVARIGHIHARLEELLSIPEIDDDHTQEIHSLLNSVDALRILPERAHEFINMLEYAEHFPSAELEKVEKSSEKALEKISDAIDKILVLLRDTPEATRDALFAYDPMLEKHYSPLFMEEEDALDDDIASLFSDFSALMENSINDDEEGVDPDTLGEEWIIDDEEDGLEDEMVASTEITFKLLSGRTPEKIYEEYYAAQNLPGFDRAEWEPVLAEALTLKLALQKEEMDCHLEPGESAAKFFEHTMGVPENIGKALLEGTLDLPIYPDHTPAVQHLTWEEVVDKITHAFHDFSPALAKRAAQPMEEGFVHVANDNMHIGFATNSQLLTSQWTGSHAQILIARDLPEEEGFQLEDLNTLAHELGHYLHYDYMQTEGNDYGKNMRNYAYMESVAHIAEHIVFPHLLDHTRGKAERRELAENFVERESGLLAKLSINCRAGIELMEGLEGRTEPYTAGEISAVMDKYTAEVLPGSLIDEEEHWTETSTLFGYGSNGMFGYYAAILAGRAFEKAFSQADEKGKAEMAEQFIGILQDPNCRNWETMMNRLGIDTRAKDFVQNLAGYPEEFIARANTPGPFTAKLAGEEKRAGRNV